MIRRVSPFASSLVAACVIAAVWAGVARACPTCNESLAGDPTQQGMVRGFFFSIVFMMAMPFVILGSFGGYAYLTVRRARRAGRRAVAPASDLVSQASE